MRLRDADDPTPAKPPPKWVRARALLPRGGGAWWLVVAEKRGESTPAAAVDSCRLPVTRVSTARSQLCPMAELVEKFKRARTQSWSGLPDPGEEASDFLVEEQHCLRHGSSLALMSLVSTALNQSDEFGDMDPEEAYSIIPG